MSCLIIVTGGGFACATGTGVPDFKPMQTAESASEPSEIHDQNHLGSDLHDQQEELPPQNQGGGGQLDPRAGEVAGEQGNIQDGEVALLENRVDELDEVIQKQLDEIISLYQRLHIELDPQGRSDLVLDVFNDPRTAIQLLGFDLIERDLSSQSEISPDIGQAARKLIRVENPLIRAKAASLITRLVLPDAMLVLTDALQKETDPIAAEPMLAGVARWPNAQASESVMHWFLRDDTLFVAACDAVWSFEEQGLWDEPGDEELGALNHERILDRLRTMAGKGNGIPLSGMKVLAKLGTPGDLELLVTFLHSQDPNQQRWAAMALVETPRATELLIQAAEGDPSLFSSAAESLITHRATPEGLRRLATLPSPDQEIRTDATVRMGNAIDVDRLGEAVKLAQLEPDLAIALLNRLLGGDVELNARSAKGVLQLVELEMHQSRPNRGLAAVRVLDQIALDPGDRVQADRYHLASLLMLGKIEEAMGLGMDAEAWFEGLDWVEDPELRQRIGQTILQFSKDSLTQEQRGLIDQIAPKVESPNPTESSEQKTEPAAEPKAGPTP